MKTKFILGMLMLVALVSLTSMVAADKAPTTKIEVVETTTVLPETGVSVEVSKFDYYNARIASAQKLTAHCELKMIEWKLFNVPAPCVSPSSCYFDGFVVSGGHYYAIYTCYEDHQPLPTKCSVYLG